MKNLFSRIGRYQLVALFLALFAGLLVSNASAVGDDITTLVTSVSGYWDTVKVIAIGILLFVLGRKVLRKL